MRRRQVFLLLVLAALGSTAAVLFWPTPRREAIARVKELDGHYQEDRDTDGRELVIVSFISKPVTDNDLVALRDIRPLHRLMLDGTQVTDAGLAHLEAVEGLEWLSLCNTAVTDAGMAHLRRIPTLRSIHVRKTNVSDAGLAHLQGMPHLGFVNVAETRVTAAGEAELRRTTPSVTTVYRVIPDD